MRCHSFIKQYLNASNADEVEHLKSELESVKAENAALQTERGPILVKREDVRRNATQKIRVEVDRKFVPFFKPGKLLRDRLNK